MYNTYLNFLQQDEHCVFSTQGGSVLGRSGHDGVQRAYGVQGAKSGQLHGHQDAPEERLKAQRPHLLPEVMHNCRIRRVHQQPHSKAI